MEFEETIKEIELNNKGQIIALKGKFRKSDLN